MTHNTGIHPAPQQSKLVNSIPFYYGWVILAAAVIGAIMTSPGQTYSVSIFIEQFIADLGINRGVISTLYMAGTLTASLAMPFVGRQIDKRGPRAMVAVVTGLFILALIWMSLVQGPVMLGIGFLFIRMLGQGSLGIIGTTMINQWWVRRRGLMLGISGVVSSILGSGMFPSLINFLIGGYGWRASYRLLALMLACIMLPVGLIFYKRSPETFGLLPDGAAVPADKTQAAQFPGTTAEEDWTAHQAVGTGAFWIIGLASASISMLGTGLQFHMVSIYEDAGLSADVAAGAFLSIAIAGALIRIISGALVDKIPARYVMFVALLGQTLGLLLAPRLQGTTSALVYSFVLGVTGSLQMTVSSVIWAKYFGRKHLGAITGLATLFNVGGSALGPMPMGIARDALGSYNVILNALAVIPFVLGIVVLFSRRPQKKSYVVSPVLE